MKIIRSLIFENDILQYTPKEYLTVADVVNEVENHFKLSLNRRKRTREYIYARAIAVVLCRKYTISVLSEIGEYFGFPSHCAPLHSWNMFFKTYQYIEEDPFNVMTNYLEIDDTLHGIQKYFEDAKPEDEDTEKERQLKMVTTKQANKIERQKNIIEAYQKLLDVSPELQNLVRAIPEHHVDEIVFKLKAILRCLPKSSIGKIEKKLVS